MKDALAYAAMLLQLQLLLLLGMPSALAADLEPSSCYTDIMDGKKVEHGTGLRLRRPGVYSVHTFFVSDQKYIYKSRKGLVTEALANVVNDAMRLGVRPLGTEYVTKRDPLASLQEGKDVVFEVLNSTAPECLPCDAPHHRFLLMNFIPGLRNFPPRLNTLFNLFDSWGLKYGALENRTHLLTSVASIALLDSVLSFKDGRQGQNCFIDDETAHFWAVDYDTCNLFNKTSMTNFLSTGIFDCISNRFKRYFFEGFRCAALQHMRDTLERSLPITDMLCRRLQANPFWRSNCPILGLRKENEPLTKKGCLAAEFGEVFLETEYVRHSQFPWDAIGVLPANHLYQPATQCIIDRARVLAFVLEIRIYRVRNMINRQMRDTC